MKSAVLTATGQTHAELAAVSDLMRPHIKSVSNHCLKDVAMLTALGAATMTLVYLTSFLRSDKKTSDRDRFQVFPSTEEIALSLKKSSRTIFSHLALIERAGYIRRDHNEMGNRRWIDLTPLAIRAGALIDERETGRKARRARMALGQRELPLDNIDPMQPLVTPVYQAPVLTIVGSEAVIDSDLQKSSPPPEDIVIHNSPNDQELSGAQFCAATGMRDALVTIGNHSSSKQIWDRTSGAVDVRLTALVSSMFAKSGRATHVTWRVAIAKFGLQTATRCLAAAIADPGRIKSEERYLGFLVKTGRICREALEAKLLEAEARIAGKIAPRVKVPRVRSAPLLDIAGEPAGAAAFRRAMLETIGEQAYSTTIGLMKATDFDGRIAIAGSYDVSNHVRNLYDGQIAEIAGRMGIAAPMIMETRSDL